MLSCTPFSATNALFVVDDGIDSKLTDATTEVSEPMPQSRAVLVALEISRVQREMMRNYSRLLDERVFRAEPTNFDSKLLISYRKKLRSEDALICMQIIFKESLSDEELEKAGLSRYFRESEVTAYGLAVALVRDSKDLAKTNSLIRSIVLAGHAYGLIDRATLSRTKVNLRCTEKLHDFMVELGKRNETLLNKFGWTLDEE